VVVIPPAPLRDPSAFIEWSAQRAGLQASGKRSQIRHALDRLLVREGEGGVDDR
jgi:hypothetical protein